MEAVAIANAMAVAVAIVCMVGPQPARAEGPLAVANAAPKPTDPRPAPAGHAFLQYGLSEHGDAVAVGLANDLGWQRPWGGGTWRAYLEGSYAHWTVRRSAAVDDPRRFHRLGLTPVLRWHPATGARWFAEVGVGLHLIGPIYRAGDKRFGSAFNFGDHVGLGWALGADRRHELTLRLQHFSNGGIKPPNPGENFLQLRWSHRY